MYALAHLGAVYHLGTHSAQDAPCEAWMGTINCNAQVVSMRHCVRLYPDMGLAPQGASREFQYGLC